LVVQLFLLLLVERRVLVQLFRGSHLLLLSVRTGVSVFLLLLCAVLLLEGVVGVGLFFFTPR